MDILGILSIIIAACGTIVAILFSAAAYKRANRKDNYQDGDQDSSLKGDIKYVRTNLDDLRVDVKEIVRKQDSHNERLTRCEESVKTAHHRINTK